MEYRKRMIRLRNDWSLWIPIALVIVSGAIYRAIDVETDSLATLTSVRAVIALVMVLGFVGMRRTASRSTNALWALMALSSLMLLVDALILSIPESATVSAGRQANRASGLANIVGYGLIVWLAVRVGSRSVWHAGLIVFSYAAVFAPTWPFLSPGLSEPTFFIARLISLAIAVIVIVLITIGFRSFDERTPDQQRKLVFALVGISVVRITVAAAPAAFITLLPAVDAAIFGVGGFAIGNGIVMTIAWLAMRSMSPRAN